MNTDLNIDLICYGVLLAGLGVLAHRSAPGIGSSVLITGIAGAVAAVFWGVLGLRGFRRRLWPISTLIVLDAVLAVQTVRAWLEVQGGHVGLKRVALILTLLLVFGLVQLLNFVQWSRRE